MGSQVSSIFYEHYTYRPRPTYRICPQSPTNSKPSSKCLLYKENCTLKQERRKDKKKT